MAQSTLTKSSTSSHRSKKPTSRRLDIQGLRAIAVLAVVANHLTGFPGGGFVGVDIFFVISGFVITLGLLREHEKNGTVSFRDFYFRRVARILPAGILTIVITVTVGYFVFFAERASSLFQDGLWALFFSANWRFATNGTDYWAEDSPISPLQHYWSLGVEEQFYFVWPLVLVLVLGLAAKFSSSALRRRYVLAAVLFGLILISFFWAMIETKSNAPWAYFSTASRAWELGVGALLAVLAPIFTSLGLKSRTILGWSGLTGLALSIVIIAKSFTFPAPWAALPVLSTALIIVAGTGGNVRGFAFLTNRVSAYIGNSSYSLYLWHFPVIILLGALWPLDDPMYYPVMLIVMAFLAWASYEFVELPAQRYLTRVYRGGGWKPLRSHQTGYGTSRAAFFVLGALAVAVVLVVPMSLRHTAPVEAAVVPAPVSSKKAASAADKGPNAARLQGQIDTALAATAWPALNPSFDNIMDAGRPEEDADGCSNTDLTNLTCVYDTGKAKTAVVFGDSTGITLLPTLRAALADEYNLRGMTKAGCLMLDLRVKDDREGFAEQCNAFRTAAIAEINRIKPSIIFLTNTSGVLGRLASGTAEGSAGPEWRDGTANILSALKPSGAQLVVITAPPSGKAPAECATRTSTPRDCIYQIPQNFYITAAAMSEAATAAGAKFIDTRGWFCGSSDYCPAFVENIPVKRDTVHTTKQYAATLVPVLKEALATQ
ncbi:acyltransferase [Paenarthrobacter nitroguajacolicus]|uniref:acyltransferase family protein n=1 Tax=Paenarthrobacter nitroguajacolicus TaxID=211146 RepID=UPI0015BFF24C|nr:acyltransferase family protein [Paenarthrobacter nitroguajacolicus]NWL13843.1 acyltransferase [Paenarthrobacter nitroguajacolicus]